jgi:hypothetical protein
LKENGEDNYAESGERSAGHQFRSSASVRGCCASQPVLETQQTLIGSILRSTAIPHPFEAKTDMIDLPFPF